MQTGLIMASTNGHLEVMQLLLEHKADVCAADEVQSNVRSCLALMMHMALQACQYKQPQAMLNLYCVAQH